MSYPLHIAIWDDNPSALKEHLIRIKEKSAKKVDEFDNRGNAPIHLCVMLNRKECLKVLLEQGDPDCRLQNRDGWSPLAEAISLGNREIINMVLKHRRKQMKQKVQESLPALFGELENLADFQMEMSWEFHSWIPFVANLCPSDTNLIAKRHSSLRLDTTIAGFEKMRWIRGSLSFLIPGNQEEDSFQPESQSVSELKRFLESKNISHSDCLEKSDLISKIKRLLALQDGRMEEFKGKVILMNHQTKGYAIASEELEKSATPEQMINILMSSPRTTTFLSNENMECKTAKTGFWGWQSDRVENIGGYQAKVYDITGISLITKVRSEHLQESGSSSSSQEINQEVGSDPDLENNPSNIPEPTQEELDASEQQMESKMQEMLKYKSSLAPPPPPAMSKEQYFAPDENDYVHLGRPHSMKKTTRTFKTKVWCCEDFPLTLDQLLMVLKPLAPSSVFVQRIVEFLEFDLPPGFPIKIEVPVLPMLSVQATFQNFVQQSAPKDHFIIPLDYIEQDRVV